MHDARAALERHLAARRARSGATLPRLFGGASARGLEDATDALGFRIEPLWALWATHDGCAPERALFEHRSFLSLADATAARAPLLSLVDLERSNPTPGLTVSEEELESQHWLPFAARGSDFLAMIAGSPHVFRVHRDLPSIALVASSLDGYLDELTSLVACDAMEWTDDFGGALVRPRPTIERTVASALAEALVDQGWMSREPLPLDRMRLVTSLARVLGALFTGSEELSRDAITDRLCDVLREDPAVDEKRVDRSVVASTWARAVRMGL